VYSIDEIYSHILGTYAHVTLHTWAYNVSMADGFAIRHMPGS
jgi:hypothetical protein